MCVFEVTLKKIQIILWNIGYLNRILKPGIPKAGCLLRCKMDFDLLLFSIFYFIKSIYISENCCELNVSVLTQAKLCQYLPCPIWPQFKTLIYILPSKFVFFPSTLITLKLQIIKVAWKASNSVLKSLSLSTRDHFQDFFSLNSSVEETVSKTSHQNVSSIKKKTEFLLQWWLLVLELVCISVPFHYQQKHIMCEIRQNKKKFVYERPYNKI